MTQNVLKKHAHIKEKPLRNNVSVFMTENLHKTSK